MEMPQGYNYDSSRVRAVPAITAGTSILGFPISAASSGISDILTAAQVAAFTGTSTTSLVADERLMPALAANTASVDRYRVMRRGPAIVQRKALRTSDPAGAAYDMAKFIAALVLSGIVVVDETGARITV